MTDFFLLLLLTVLYILAMYFLLWPINEYYTLGNIQAFLAPLSFLAIFWFHSYDILFMAIHTLLINLYVAYYVMDPDS